MTEGPEGWEELRKVSVWQTAAALQQEMEAKMIKVRKSIQINNQNILQLVERVLYHGVALRRGVLDKGRTSADDAQCLDMTMSIQPTVTTRKSEGH